MNEASIHHRSQNRRSLIAAWTKPIGILASIASAVTFGVFIGSEEGIPDAVPIAGLYLQPGVLMTLPARRASLDLAAGLIAGLLGVGIMLIPYAAGIGWVVAAALLSITSAIAALVHNSFTDTKGDAAIALLAVALVGASLFASHITVDPRCQESDQFQSCVDDTVTSVEAAASTGALWLSAGIVWVAARPKSRSEIS